MAHSFGNSSQCLIGPVGLEAVARQQNMVGAHSGAKLLASWLGASRVIGPGPTVPFKDIPTVT